MLRDLHVLHAFASSTLLNDVLWWWWMAMAGLSDVYVCIFYCILLLLCLAWSLEGRGPVPSIHSTLGQGLPSTSFGLDCWRREWEPFSPKTHYFCPLSLSVCGRVLETQTNYTSRNINPCMVVALLFTSTSTITSIIIIIDSICKSNKVFHIQRSLG